jgi:putative transposase
MQGAASGAVDNPTSARHHLTTSDFCPNKRGHLSIDGANRHDMKLVRPTLEDLKLARPAPTAQQPQGLCLDKGMIMTRCALVAEFGVTAHVRARGQEAQQVKREAGFRARR